ncbi:MAG: bile acid:sodium symporter, partial [Saprospiraceae bacterium]|nr:bile acid:sodium symporter [Saprospiraceae bacterium]
FLQKFPGLFAGLALASLLPTSSMTITYTLLAGGNVPGALKITIISLILGSSLSPFYLFLMVGQYMPFNIETAVRTLALIIFLPMAAGIITFQSLTRFMTIKKFEQSIRPYLPGVSAILATTIICISVGMESRAVASNPHLLLRCLAVQAAFYLMNYFISVIVSRLLRLGNQDGLALLYSTVLRNLAISIGMAAGMFGSQAALMVSLAFLIQPIAAAWFIRINKKWRLLEV